MNNLKVACWQQKRIHQARTKLGPNLKGYTPHYPNNRGADCNFEQASKGGEPICSRACNHGIELHGDGIGERRAGIYRNRTEVHRGDEPTKEGGQKQAQESRIWRLGFKVTEGLERAPA
jgi:hypothetical protein